MIETKEMNVYAVLKELGLLRLTVLTEVIKDDKGGISRFEEVTYQM